MKTKQRKTLCTAVLTALAMLTLGCDISEDRPLTVVSWGGSYARACVKGYHEAFTAETGIKINLEDYNGGLAQIRAQVQAGNVHWDVVDLRFPTWAQGCDEGLLEHVEIDSLPAGADGTPAEEDFLFGTSTDCGVATLFYSTIYAYNEENIPGEKPTTMADFFDIEKFPGRCTDQQGICHPRHARRRGSRLPQAGHHQRPHRMVGSRGAASTDARRWRGGDDHGLQRAHLQCTGIGKSALCHRVGRTNTGSVWTCYCRGNAEPRSRKKISQFRLNSEGYGRRR